MGWVTEQGERSLFIEVCCVCRKPDREWGGPAFLARLGTGRRVHADCLPSLTRCGHCGGPFGSTGCVDGQCVGSRREAPGVSTQEAHTQPGESGAAGQDVRMVPRWMFDLMRDQVDDLAEIARLAKRALPKADEAVRLLRQGVDQPTYQDGFAAACARLREEADALEGGDPATSRVLFEADEFRAIIDRVAGEGK